MGSQCDGIIGMEGKAGEGGADLEEGDDWRVLLALASSCTLDLYLL